MESNHNKIFCESINPQNEKIRNICALAPISGGGGRTSLTLCQTYESHFKNPHLKSQPIAIARFCIAESKQSARSANPPHPVIARALARSIHLKSFLLLFCFCKKVESLYPLDSNLQRMKFLGCFGKSLIRLAMTHFYTTFKGFTMQT